MATTTLTIRLSDTQRADLARVAADAGLGPATFARITVVAALAGQRRTAGQRRRDRLARGLAETQGVLSSLVARCDLGHPLDLGGHALSPGADGSVASVVEGLRREIHRLVETLLSFANTEKHGDSVDPRP